LPFYAETFEEFQRWLIIGVLLQELAADGEIKDGLAELLDLVGAGGEAREMADEELGTAAQGFCIRSVVQVMMGSVAERTSKAAMRSAVLETGQELAVAGKSIGEFCAQRLRGATVSQGSGDQKPEPAQARPLGTSAKLFQKACEVYSSIRSCRRTFHHMALQSEVEIS
jgi:hypothetical protein